MPMKNGDIEFHEQTASILDVISNEGLRIAKENGWGALVIEMEASQKPIYGVASRLRCSLRNPLASEEIDEPSAELLDAANQLQDVFASVETPLVGAMIDWIDEKGDGRVRRQCSYRYE